MVFSLIFGATHRLFSVAYLATHAVFDSGKKFPEELANVRLPLRPLIYLGGKEAFNQVLKDEIQPENFESWVESARSEKHVFKQSPDVICVQVHLHFQPSF